MAGGRSRGRCELFRAFAATRKGPLASTPGGDEEHEPVAFGGPSRFSGSGTMHPRRHRMSAPSSKRRSTVGKCSAPAVWSLERRHPIEASHLALGAHASFRVLVVGLTRTIIRFVNDASRLDGPDVDARGQLLATIGFADTKWLPGDWSKALFVFERCVEAPIVKDHANSPLVIARIPHL